jgi:hypothetical protein
MSKTIKKFTIIKTHNNVNLEFIGTLAELIESFGYTLECGKSWEFEKGNHKINDNPKSINTFVKNLNWAIIIVQLMGIH